WTAERVTRLVREHFYITYHPEHVRKILKRRLHWTSQKPRRKPRERNDKEDERWKGDELPRNLRQESQRQGYVVIRDVAGIQLHPAVRRTLAPRGQTPVLDAWDQRDRISAISCLTLSPQQGRPGLYFELLPVNRTVHAEEVVAFLKALRRQLRGSFTVGWDRHRIHSRSSLGKAFLARHPEVGVGDCRGYMPDLNPAEAVWSWTKYGRLSNLAAWDTTELWDHVVEALIDLKFQPQLLHAFIRHAGIPVAA